MSTKSLIIAISITAVVLFASHFLTYKVSYNKGYDDAVATLTQDSTVTDTLTVVKRDTVYVYFPVYTDAIIDTIGDDIVYSTKWDTTVVMDEDTVAVLKQDISLSDGVFAILTDLELRPVEKLVEITKTVFRTVKVPVPADPPFYNTYLFGSVSTIVVILLMVLLL